MNCALWRYVPRSTIDELGGEFRKMVLFGTSTRLFCDGGTLAVVLQGNRRAHGGKALTMPPLSLWPSYYCQVSFARWNRREDGWRTELRNSERRFAASREECRAEQDRVSLPFILLRRGRSTHLQSGAHTASLTSVPVQAMCQARASSSRDKLLRSGAFDSWDTFFFYQQNVIAARISRVI